MNEKETLAQAAYYIPEMVRGVEGKFEIEEDGWGQGNAQAAVEEIHSVQRALTKAGWRRNKAKEKLAPYSHNIEVACYTKQFKPGQKNRWVYITIATRFGVVAKFVGGDWESLSW